MRIISGGGSLPKVADQAFPFTNWDPLLFRDRNALLSFDCLLNNFMRSPKIPVEISFHRSQLTTHDNQPSYAGLAKSFSQKWSFPMVYRYIRRENHPQCQTSYIPLFFRNRRWMVFQKSLIDSGKVCHEWIQHCNVSALSTQAFPIRNSTQYFFVQSIVVCSRIITLATS